VFIFGQSHYFLSSTLWSSGFHGETYFIFGNCPAYKQRKTRDLGYFVIGFQPRMIFEGLEGTSEWGSMSQEKVRERVAVWDDLPKHPDISHYGDPIHNEWKQFFIDDDIVSISGYVQFDLNNILKNDCVGCNQSIAFLRLDVIPLNQR
jgi:FPC/CPF motif-containing protein YcgG